MTKETSIRPRLTTDEYKAVIDFRERHSALAKECEETGVPKDDVNYYWYKSEKFSMNVKNKQQNYFEVRDRFIADMKKHSPSYKLIKYPKVKESYLLVIDPADIHFGKLCNAVESGEDYNTQIAVERVRNGVAGILNKAKGFNIDKILFIIGNDILHVDTPRSTTTSGTPQDTDGMWYTNFLTAKKIYVEIIETLLQLAPVHVQYDPSNHDYQSGFFLADSVHSWFSKCKGVTFNVSIQHRKYFPYGKNIIGTTHGDGAKTADLPLLMAQEASEHWHYAKHRYMYIHHIHHKMSKDYGSVCVEALRSPSGTDSWHHRNGYQHSPKAIEAFIHCKDHGQIARLTHIF